MPARPRRCSSLLASAEQDAGPPAPPFPAACATDRGRELEALLTPDRLDSFDEAVAAACRQAARAEEATASREGEGGLEDQLAGEMRERLMADLLYLAAARSFIEAAASAGGPGGRAAIPSLPSFDAGPSRRTSRWRTWAASGGSPDWKALADEGCWHEVPVEPLRRVGRVVMRQTILDEQEEYGSLLDAYLGRETGGLAAAAALRGEEPGGVDRGLSQSNPGIPHEPPPWPSKTPVQPV